MCFLIYRKSVFKSCIKMADITEIMDMLDWYMPSEIRIKGVSLARNTEHIN